ncbi:signal peptide peptidase SppA [Halalkalibacter nanhaiisediminis]|uniref:Signal peptide peptidase A n=1 Tax=Halalkalibacter nanhaiisediminis TaxID=688079 RepID=A0A562QJJ9_9BACI|nr:signal peptide peptidase SppA [Halalkalibacter nanhaiisediminis]TWI56958.1 signal peptide peptidase A [Halalkalibacter nanhaiisediminis]
MSRKRWLALIAVAMLLVASISVNIATSSVFSDTNAFFGTMDQEWTETVIETGQDITGSIAVLELNGVIQDTGEVGLFQTGGYQHQMFLSQLDYAAEDPSVEGIIIRVNTPGGGVVESAEIYEKIINAQVEYEKPVFVSMGSMAASGGYYIAAPADMIVASPQTITGSIGVIMESINVAQLAENYGIEVNTIKSGPYKDIMSATREMTEEERAILQSLIDESYDEFVRIIAEGRQMSEEEVRTIADGRIYSGNQALELNLVDELGSLDDTIALMKEYVGADYNVVQYESGLGFPQFFSMSMERMFTSDHELAVLQRLLSDHRSPTLKYLYTE